MPDFRHLPSVDRILQSQEASEWLKAFGRPLTLEAVRSTLDEIRKFASEGTPIPDQETIYKGINARLKEWVTPTLRPVINASGVIIHTNLGRAPLSQAALQSIQAVSAGYNTLEFDLESGKRGKRELHAESLLCRLTGAEAALIVNNNAAAVLLILSGLAHRKQVLISRTQLVEIGGGFRIPDVMKQSGAKILEIGTTNRVHLHDYTQALQEFNPALVMRAHSSNFKLVGFTTEPSLGDIVNAAHHYQTPVVDDLGSGTLLDTAAFGLAHEPTIQESLTAGVDLVCFSGDKLLGGPQAGIILGKSEWVNRLRKHPLMRAVRPDKLCLAGLSATLLHYLKDEALTEIPVWQMISQKPEQLQTRVIEWQTQLGSGTILPGLSTVGGGSLPEETLPTTLLAFHVNQPNKKMEILRRASTPVIARIQDDLLVVDPRTVLPHQETDLLNALKTILVP